MKGKENLFFRDFSSFQRVKITERNVREDVWVSQPARPHRALIRETYRLTL
jgi:hypothetical protein